MLEEKIYTVSELTENIKALIEENFYSLWVEGEISNLTQSPGGHYHFTLKDEKAQLEAILFKGRARPFLKFLRNGAKVLCYGSLTVYAPKGRYQLEVVSMKETGLGDLYVALEKLKEKLEKEGLFDERYKKPIPFLPRKIGIVTSPRGAAIRDILNIIKRRFAKVRIILYPSKVQGENAAEEIAEGIKFFNETKLVDVIIVTRGGGSIEDLWSFNEEIVARAIFESEIPVISAVGHQRDYTIADLVADLRAPTPSAAAELVVKREEDILKELASLKKRMENLIVGKLGVAFSNFSSIKRRLELKDPRRKVSEGRLKLDDLSERLFNTMEKILQNKRERINALSQLLYAHTPDREITKYKERLKVLQKELFSLQLNFIKERKHRLSVLKAKVESQSPKVILSKGYAICYDQQGRIIKDAFKVAKDSIVKVELAKGALICKVKDRQIL